MDGRSGRSRERETQPRPGGGRAAPRQDRRRLRYALPTGKDADRAARAARRAVRTGLSQVDRRRTERDRPVEYGDPPQPWIYLIVATDETMTGQGILLVGMTTEGSSPRSCPTATSPWRTSSSATSSLVSRMRCGEGEISTMDPQSDPTPPGRVVAEAARPLVVVGGPRFGVSAAESLGVDRIFGKGITPGEIASYLAHVIGTGWDR